MTAQSTTQLSSSARSAINSTGRRMTSQRATLLKIIQEASDHLDAEEIHRRAHDRGERVSLSTVYRTLDLLKELKLVDELHLWDEHHHYESRTAEEHCHLLCQICGGVTELSGSAVRRMRAFVSRETGFRIVHGQMDFEGVCASCQREAGSKEEAGRGGSPS
ncbi:MAG TPA: Fur family transcriptional regulator [Chloroflexota bacterium]